jgi:NADPH:quinone reductase-like Zn-dependent oxidoreductase
MPDYKDAVLKATNGKGVNLVVNTVGGSAFSHSMSCLGFQGRFAVVGYVDGVLEATVDLEQLHTKRIKVFGVSNKLRTSAQRAQAITGFSAQILPALGSGQIQPMLDKVFDFGELPEAKAYMEANRHVGKIVLAVR